MNRESQVTEAEILTILEQGYEFPPLRVRLAGTASQPGLDARIEITADDRVYEFDAEFKARSTPKVFEEALLRLDASTRGSDRRGLLVVPYLRESQLDELQRRRLSGLDLSGNGVVTVPGELFVYRTGQPNRYRESTPTRFAYRGATSLVARAFLCRPAYGSLTDVADEIEKRGGRVVLSTVSKALKRMESDLIVDRTPQGLRLRQPEKLLDALVEDYRPPKITRTVTLALRETTAENLVSRRPPGIPLTLTGGSSITKYAVMGRAEWPAFYTTDIERLLGSWKEQVRETSRFVDLELRQTDDPTVYFDTRDREGLPYASPVQVYLEGSAGDKREREAVEEVRERILTEHRRAGEV